MGRVGMWVDGRASEYFGHLGNSTGKEKDWEPLATCKVDQCRSNITLLEEHNQFARGYMWLERVTGLSRVLYIMLNNLHFSYGQS